MAEPLDQPPCFPSLRPGAEMQPSQLLQLLVSPQPKTRHALDLFTYRRRAGEGRSTNKAAARQLLRNLAPESAKAQSLQAVARPQIYLLWAALAELRELISKKVGDSGLSCVR